MKTVFYQWSRLYYLFGTMILLILSCSEVERVETVNKNISIDSTYNSYLAKEYIDSSIQIGNSLTLFPLSSRNQESIRVRNRSGWGNFDAIATIYRNIDCEVQMVKQIINHSQRGFQIQEFTLSAKICDSIFSIVDNPKFYSLPFDLEPDIKILDGEIFSITHKGIDKDHTTTWQLFDDDFYRDESITDNLLVNKGIARKIYHDLFKFSKRPPPCISFYLNATKNDSFVYLTGIEESHDFIDSINYSCLNCRVIYSTESYDTIIEKVNYDEYRNIDRSIDYRLLSTEGIIFSNECTYFIDDHHIEDNY